MGAKRALSQTSNPKEKTPMILRSSFAIAALLLASGCMTSGSIAVFVEAGPEGPPGEAGPIGPPSTVPGPVGPTGATGPADPVPDASTPTLDAGMDAAPTPCQGLSNGCPDGYSCQTLCGTSSPVCLLSSEFQKGCHFGDSCQTTCGGTLSCHSDGSLTVDGCPIANDAGVLLPLTCQKTCSDGLGCYPPGSLNSEGCPTASDAGACLVSCYTLSLVDGGAVATPGPVACFPAGYVSSPCGS